MGLGRALLCMLLPPLAVLDKGCGSVLLVGLLTIAGWVPGILAALFICSRDWPISPPSPAPILKMLNSAIPRSAVHLIRPLVTV